MPDRSPWFISADAAQARDIAVLNEVVATARTIFTEAGGDYDLYSQRLRRRYPDLDQLKALFHAR